MPADSSTVTPVRPPFRWRHYSLVGAGLMTGKALVLSVLLTASDPALRTFRIFERVIIIALTLGIPGAIGGVAYAVAAHFQLGYYPRWILSAEVAALVLLLEIGVARASLFKGQEAGAEQVAFFIATNPIGWLILGAVAAIGGVAYGKALAD